MKNENSCRPNYTKYPGQHFPQKAYIQVDEDGLISSGFSGEIGNAIPVHVFNDVTMRWQISPHLTHAEIDETIEMIRPKIEKLMSKTWIDYGSNARSGIDRELSLEIELDLSFESEDDSSCSFDDCEYCKQEGAKK